MRELRCLPLASFLLCLANAAGAQAVDWYGDKFVALKFAPLSQALPAEERQQLAQTLNALHATVCIKQASVLGYGIPGFDGEPQHARRIAKARAEYVAALLSAHGIIPGTDVHIGPPSEAPHAEIVFRYLPRGAPTCPLSEAK
jgi:hypothetical protein